MAMLILSWEGYVGDDEGGGDGGDGKDGEDGGDGDLLQHGLAHIAGNHFGKVRRKELRELTTSAPSSSFMVKSIGHWILTGIKIMVNVIC